MTERGVVTGSQQKDDLDSIAIETLQYGDSQELTRRMESRVLLQNKDIAGVSVV